MKGHFRREKKERKKDKETAKSCLVSIYSTSPCCQEGDVEYCAETSTAWTGHEHVISRVICMELDRSGQQ